MSALEMNQPVLIITGTSKGLGLSMSRLFADRGWKVIGCARSESQLSHDNYEHFVVDLADERQVQSWIRQVRTKYGRIDYLVCNAGLVKSSLYMAVTSGAMVDAFLKTNISATFFVCREVAKVMLPKKTGRIIAISSIMTEIHEPGTALYSSTKAAVNELMKVMAREFAPSGITCNIISPAMTVTESSQALGQEWAERMLAMQTIPRPVTVEEVCNGIEFFCRPESSCITGQVINMCLVN